MKIKSKLALLSLGFSLIPLILISNLYINNSKNTLEKSIGVNFERIAKEKANTIDNIMRNMVTEVSLLAEITEIKEIIKKSNSGYDGRSNEEIMNKIMTIDESWIKSKETNEDADRILNNEISIFLEEYKEKNSEKYGEIFISDKKGAAVAMTKILTDYYQADEQWWQAVFIDGEDVFIDDRGFDESVGALIIGVVVPVKENGEVIGVLKLNYKVTELINIIGEPIGETDSIILTRSQGDILTSSLEDNNIKRVELGQNILRGKSSGYEEHENERGDIITGYAPIKTLISTRVPSPEERKGISGEKWEPTTWFIILEIEKAEAFIPIQILTNWIISTSSIFIILILIAVYFSASSISDPIEKLTQAIGPISEGKFDVKINEKILKLKNEIGQLARSFNVMTKKLQTLYGTLEKKVEDRTAELNKLNSYFIGREERIIELKEIIKKLKKRK